MADHLLGPLAGFFEQARAIVIGHLILAGTIAALCVIGWWRNATKRWLPFELWRTNLAYSERLFRSKGSLRVTARLDRAYRTRKGHLVLVELKTRGRDDVYPSDVIELSAQRFAVSEQTGRPVADHGYVLISSGNDRTYRRVRLLTTEAVRRLAIRRAALLEGLAAPRPPSSPALCVDCAFRNRCDVRR